MSKIKLLDDLTIQKIAAGEVIERPGSIVKELVENSIDAGAKNIVIEIKNGGKSYIRITDDGEGMNRDDLKLAFKRHSTSKLASIEDLYNIISLGFRGEALSSIVSISKVEVLTKTEDDLAGLRVLVENGEIVSIDPVGSPKGTTLIVEDLFYNIPVRKKFLKSDLAEGNFISNIINNLALGHFDVSFKFIRDNKVILNTGKNNNILDSIYKVLGKDISSNLIPLTYEDYNFKIKGFISNNNLYRGNRGHEYLYVNNRYVVNPGISKVIENRYKSLIPLNRFPVFLLYITIDPNKIDVNIHPTKEEIKFIDRDIIFGTISNVIYEHLNKSISVPKMEFENKVKEDKIDSLPKLNYEFPNKNNLNDDLDHQFEDLIIHDFTDEGLSKVSSGGKPLDKSNPEDKDSDNKGINYELLLNKDGDYRVEEVDFKLNKLENIGKEPTNMDNIFAGLEIAKGELGSKDQNNSSLKEANSHGLNSNELNLNKLNLDILDISDVNSKNINSGKTYEPQKIDHTLLNMEIIGRAFNTYIIVESKEDKKLFFIDQHAAHERVMYEKYKKEYREEKIHTQQLISPEIIELTHSEKNNFMENIDLFRKLGYDLDEFGSNSIAIRGLPIIFGVPSAKTLFLDLLDGLKSEIKTSYDVKLEKIMKLSCTSAIKGGDKLDNREIYKLIEDLIKCENPYTCPHGRPTMIEMSKKTIEKEFLRIN